MSLLLLLFLYSFEQVHMPQQKRTFRCHVCIIQMQRLLGRHPRAHQPPRRTRHLSLKSLLAVTALAVIAFVSWVALHSSHFYRSTSAVNTVSTSAAEGVDYGHIATLELADDTFATDGWLSQLRSYLHINRRLVGNRWADFHTGLNSTCPFAYTRLR